MGRDSWVRHLAVAFGFRNLMRFSEENDEMTWIEIVPGLKVQEVACPIMSTWALGEFAFNSACVSPHCK